LGHLISVQELPFSWFKNMKSYIISAWILLLATTACIQKVIGQGHGAYIGEVTQVTPLMRATSNNDVDLVKQLLANGADAKAANSNGITALMIAAEYGTTQMVEILLPKSDAKAKEKYGNTALMYAAKWGNDHMVRILLPKSDAKARNCIGYSALMIAARYGTEEAIKLLIPESDVTATNTFRQTALEYFKRRCQYRECEDQMNIVNLLSSNIP